MSVTSFSRPRRLRQGSPESHAALLLANGGLPSPVPEERPEAAMQFVGVLYPLISFLHLVFTSHAPSLPQIGSMHVGACDQSAMKGRPAADGSAVVHHQQRLDVLLPPGYRACRSSPGASCSAWARCSPRARCSPWAGGGSLADAPSAGPRIRQGGLQAPCGEKGLITLSPSLNEPI